jgi:hypothetical protein
MGIEWLSQSIQRTEDRLGTGLPAIPAPPLLDLHAHKRYIGLIDPPVNFPMLIRDASGSRVRAAWSTEKTGKIA